MQVSFRGILRSVYKSDSGVSYLRFVDLDTGGDVNLSLPAGVDLDLSAPSAPIQFEAVVSGRAYNNRVNYSIVGTPSISPTDFSSPKK